MYYFPPEVINNKLNNNLGNKNNLPQKYIKNKNDYEKLLDELINQAYQLRICATKYKKTDENGKTHYYLLCSTDKNAIDDFNKNSDILFQEWKNRQTEQDTGIVLLDKVMFDITDIDEVNYYSKLSYIIRYQQNMGIVNLAFSNHNLSIPDHVSIHVCQSIYELDQMRDNPQVPFELREKYEKTYRDAINKYAKDYEDDYKLEKPKTHQVDEKYFKENHISVTWDVVNEPFYQFILERIQDENYKDFLYCKDDKAYINTKNTISIFKRIKGKRENDNKNQVVKYYFGFPSSQNKMFYTLMNEYNTRFCQSRISISELEKQERALKQIYINKEDIHSFDYLCNIYHVKWAINNGSIFQEKIVSNSASEHIPILYKESDNQLIVKIIEKITKDLKEKIPYTKSTIGEIDHTKYVQETIDKIMSGEIEVKPPRKNKERHTSYEEIR